MTIYQPEDKTLTKERIEGILIAANILLTRIVYSERDKAVERLNDIPYLKGQFELSEMKHEIVFVAQ